MAKKEKKLRVEKFGRLFEANYQTMRLELADKLTQALRRRDVAYPTIFCLTFPEDEKHLEAIADLIADYFRKNGF